MIPPNSSKLEETLIKDKIYAKSCKYEVKLKVKIKRKKYTTFKAVAGTEHSQTDYVQ